MRRGYLSENTSRRENDGKINIIGRKKIVSWV